MSANLMSLAKSGGKFLKLFGDRKMMKPMPTARDYVQDGLIAMWDGIENAGWGIHDANATVWKNLVGTEDMVLNQSFEYDIYNDSMLFRDDNRSGSRARSQMSITMTEDMTIEGMMLIPNARPIWDVRMCIGLLYDIKTGVFPFARGVTSIPSLKYTASYNDNSDRYFGNPKVGETVSSSIVFRRAAKSFDGYYNGEFVSTIGSQEDNWLGDNIVLHPVFIYKQLSDTMIGCDFRINYMRIYSRALTTEEIAHNYAIDKARFNLPDKTI